MVRNAASSKERRRGAFIMRIQLNPATVSVGRWERKDAHWAWTWTWTWTCGSVAVWGGGREKMHIGQIQLRVTKMASKQERLIENANDGTLRHIVMYCMVLY